MNPNTLSYRPSHSAVYYTTPKRIDVGRTIIAFILSAAGVVLVAFVYAKLQANIENIYLRLGEWVAGAVIVGVIAMAPTRFGHVRLPVLAACTGALLATLAIYVMWVTWAHRKMHQMQFPIGYTDLIKKPRLLMNVIRLFGTVGAWKYKGDLIHGTPLFTLWVVEASAFLLGGIGLPLAGVTRGEDPICLSCRSRCKLVRPIARFAMEIHDRIVADVEGRNFAPLAGYPPPANEDDPQLSVRLLSCPSCGQTNVVTMNKITWIPDRNSGRKLDIRPVVNQIMITSEEAEQLKDAFKQLVENRKAAEALEEEPKTVSQTMTEEADPHVDDRGMGS